MTDDGVAIVGMAALFPGAPDLATFGRNIAAGVDATSQVPDTRWDPVFFDPDAKAADRFYCRRGGFVDDLARFDPLAFGMMPVSMESAEPDQLLALAAAAAALADAGQPHERIDPSKVAVVLGRGGYIGDGVARLDQRVRTAQQLVEALRSLVPELDDERLQQVKEEFQDRLGPERPEGSIGLVPNLAASRIANRFDLRGPAYTVDAACASSLIAVDHAVTSLRSGQSDLVLAGGVHHCHDLTLWSVFSQLRALSPTEQIRPFSEAADGILVGEGTGILVLKRLADAHRDDDRIYAVIRGTGVASDGNSASLMSPAAAGQVLAVEQAWKASGLDPDRIGLIEAHGTATPLGDRVELDTLRTVFGPADPSKRRAGLGSVKSMIGHAMPAAGAAGLIKSALAIFGGELPPTLHVDEPNEAVAATRFRLITETEPWEGDAPRVAGVNAFGFGGINAHVVLEEAPGRRSRRSRPGPSTVPDAAAEPVEEVLLLAGDDAADLLAQLDTWSSLGPAPLTVPTGGPARLAIVSPNERRLQLARKVLERGTAFRGRNDVWFDPDGLVAVGAKVAFLYPGVEPVFEPHVDDVAAAFGLPWDGLATDGSALENQGRGLVAVGRLLTDALDRIGIAPDLMAGHSLGEWTGQIASGMIPASYVELFLASLRSRSIEVSDVVFVALGCGAETAAGLVDGIDDAYVSHDNCPHQSVICAPAERTDELMARAKDAKVLAQELPFRSGFHSPLFAPYVAALAEQFGAIPLVPPTVPMWSATSVAPYPSEPSGIAELSGRHLVEPVRFRALADRLYAEGVRVFVQVGTGSLGGFLDDTLRGHDVLTISANAAKQTGIGQLRRVAAALWSTGVAVDFAPLGHRLAESAPSVRRSTGTPVPLALGSSLVRDLTPLALRPGPTAAQHAALDDTDGPHLAEFRAALDEATAALDDVLGAAQARSARSISRQRGGAPSAPPADPNGAGRTGTEPTRAHTAEPAATAAASPAGVARSRTGSPLSELSAPAAAGALPADPPAPAPASAAPGGPPSHETVHALSVIGQPHWRDHSFYEQPEGWPLVEDTFPLVPMTAILELLAAEAEALAPGQVVVNLEAVRAFKWLAVDPPVAVTVRAVLDGEVGGHEGGTTVARSSIDRHARAQVRLASAYPPAPAPAAAPVRGELAMPVTVERLYDDRHLFHGPAYQGIRSFTAFGTDGVAGRLESQPAPGALLDNAGQLFGFWMASLVDRDRLVLPTSIDRISFFGPHPEPGTAVDCVVNLTSLTDQAARADLELTVDGTVWCRIEGWEDRRFQSDDRLFLLLRQPADRLLAEPQPGGWVLVREGWPDSASRDVVMRRFLGKAERTDYEARNPNVQRTWLLGRIAVKDAVRHLLWSTDLVPDHGRIFPIEVHVANDADGRPRVEGPVEQDLRASIAHTAGLGVAIAAVGVDVGIDIEKVEPRTAAFESASFTGAESTLLLAGEPGERDRELTRGWAAKEAAAKAAGAGMGGRPKDFEIVEIAGDRVRIGNRWIATEILSGQDEHVVAWTVIDTNRHEDQR